MILDKNTEFSDSQAVTATALSTNVLDLYNQSTPLTQDVGLGEPIWLVIQVDTAATAVGAATVTFTLETDVDTALSTSPTIHWTSAAIGKATLIAGYQVAAIRLESASFERYMAVRYTVATGPLTAGAFSAFLTKDLQRNRVYPSSFTVDV